MQVMVLYVYCLDLINKQVIRGKCLHQIVSNLSGKIILCNLQVLASGKGSIQEKG